MWSSDRWVMSIAGMVESRNAAGRSLQIAEVGLVVLVTSRTASRTWVRCCNARVVRNSELLRGLDAALLGQSVTESRYVDCIVGASRSKSVLVAWSCRVERVGN